MKTSRAGGLNKRWQFQLVQRVVDYRSGLQHLVPGRSLDRIEIKVKVIGTVDIVTAGIPWVQVYAAQIDHPQERADIPDHWKIDDVAGSMLDAAGLDPFGSGRRGALHEEKIAPDSVGITLHDHGAVSEMWEQHMRDVQIKLDQVGLRNTRVRPKHLAKIG